MGFFVFLATIFLFTYLPVPFYFRLILPAMWWIGDGIRLKWMVEKSNKALTVPNSPSKDWIEAYQVLFFFLKISTIHKLIRNFYIQPQKDMVSFWINWNSSILFTRFVVGICLFLFLRIFWNWLDMGWYQNEKIGANGKFWYFVF